MSDRLADWDRFAVDKIQAARHGVLEQRLLEQLPAQSRERVQTRDELRVGTKPRKASAPVIGNQEIGLFQRCHPKDALHQSNGKDFGIREGRDGVVGTSPAGLGGMRLEKIRDENVDLGQRIYYTVHGSGS